MDGFDNTSALAVKIMDEAVTRIRANMARHYRTSKGERWINASGRSAQAFKVEVANDAVRLVYRGDDVAPLASLEEGSREVPTVEDIESWRAAKMASGAGELPPAAVIVEYIRMRGTERVSEPQPWVVRPELLAAVDELKSQIKEAFVVDASSFVFGKK